MIPALCILVLSDPGATPEAVAQVLLDQLQIEAGEGRLTKGDPRALGDKLDCAKAVPVAEKLRKAGARVAVVGKGKNDVELSGVGGAAFKVVNILRTYGDLDLNSAKAKTQGLPKKLGFQLDDVSAGVLVTDLVRFGAKARAVRAP